jgi:hypothetical protein
LSGRVAGNDHGPVLGKTSPDPVATAGKLFAQMDKFHAHTDILIAVITR